MQKIQIAVYKGPGDWIDKLIRWRINHIYSHCELVLNEYSYSSSPRDNGVRRKAIIYDPDKWDIFTIDPTLVSSSRVLGFFQATKGMKYDYLGILLGHLFKTYWHWPSRYFCSKWCATALNVPQPHKYNSATLVHYLHMNGLIK